MAETLVRYGGPNHDIPRPDFVDIPSALPREMLFRVAVIADGALTPIGNSGDETWEAVKAMRSGIVERRYPPYTEPTYLIPDEIVDKMTKRNLMLRRLRDTNHNSPHFRRFVLNEFLLKNPEVKVEDLKLKMADPQIRAVTAGTVKNYDPIESLVKTGFMPRKEVFFKMGPYAQYAATVAFEMLSKIRTARGTPFLIPRLKEDGTPDRDYRWTINEALVNRLYVATLIATGFGGGAVSAEVLEWLKESLIPEGDHMMRSLNDRADSPITQATDANGGAEADTAACASSGKALINAILRIVTGVSEVGVVIGTEGLEKPLEWSDGRSEENPITAAEFDSLGALDTGSDPLKVSRSLHQDRRGFTIAEGAAGVVICDVDWARRHSIPILYYIEGFGDTSGAGHNTEPNGPAQEKAMRFARRRAERSGKIEGKVLNSGHYTGTYYGEISELPRTQNVLEDMQDRTIIYGSKRLVGHMLGPAGLYAQFVAGRVLQTGIVPGMPFDGAIMDEAYGWNVPTETYYDSEVTDALVNQFGFGDANVSLWLRKA